MSGSHKARSVSAVRTLIVADDLTGACDAAIAFADRGTRTRVLIDPRHSHNAEVVAVSTGTRDIPEADAVTKMSSVAAEVQRDQWPRVFKKIDSAFRGNTVAEIVSFARAFKAGLTVIAPAYPALGRQSVEGHIKIRDLGGERVLPALRWLEERGLNSVHIRSGITSDTSVRELIAAARARSHTTLYLDPADQAEMEFMVQRIHSVTSDVLWIGSGGLAHALAASSPARNAEIPEPCLGRVLVFVGTDHPVSKSQLAHLKDCKDVDVHDWSSSPLIPISPASNVLHIPITCGTTRSSEIASFAEFIDPHSVACIFMTGGDTAAVVCEALRITALDLHREFAPGLPQASAVGGRFDRTSIVLKSGGFGDVDTVTKVVQHFAPKEVCIE